MDVLLSEICEVVWNRFGVFILLGWYVFNVVDFVYIDWLGVDG